MAAARAYNELSAGHPCVRSRGRGARRAPRRVRRGLSGLGWGVALLVVFRNRRGDCQRIRRRTFQYRRVPVRLAFPGNLQALRSKFFATAYRLRHLAIQAVGQHANRCYVTGSGLRQ